MIAYWVIFHAFLSSADFFQNLFFEKILSGIPSECQSVWTLIRPDDSSGLIWVQTVCQSYQQTTLVDKVLNPWNLPEKFPLLGRQGAKSLQRQYIIYLLVMKLLPLSDEFNHLQNWLFE